MLATLALQPQDNLLGGFCLLVEDGLSLTTITGLFAIITTLSLSSNAILTLLVLGNLVQCVLPAFLALAVGLLCLWNVHHGGAVCGIGLCRESAVRRENE